MPSQTPLENAPSACGLQHVCGISEHPRFFGIIASGFGFGGDLPDLFGGGVRPNQSESEEAVLTLIV